MVLRSLRQNTAVFISYFHLSGGSESSLLTSPLRGGREWTSPRAGGGMNKKHAWALRSQLTDPERILWKRLRVLKDRGLHFRRQASFGNYVLDFVCHRAKLIVELDGSQHAKEKQIRQDAKRTTFLESRGYRVMRVWNNDVFENPDGVAEAVLAFALAPHPIRLREGSAGSTSPQGGGEVRNDISWPE